MSEKTVASKEAVRRRHKNIYFQPGQLIFLTYGNLGGAPETVQELIDWANNLAPNGIVLSASSDDVFDFNPVQYPDVVVQLTALPPYLGRSYTSPAAEIPPPPFSLVFANATSENWLKFSAVPEDPENQEDWEDEDDDDDEDDDHEDQDEQEKALNELLDLVILLDEKRATAPVQLEVVSPNWLMSGGSQPGGTGGPGGKPWPVNGADINKYHFSALSQTPDNGSGNGVVVAILDTAYSDVELETTYETWVSGKPTEEQHPLIKALLGKNPLARGALRNSDDSLRVYIDPAVEGYLPNVTIDGHDYEMTDHGLFVAGIINSIASQAEIHLFKVLNKYGLGDLRSIAGALQKIQDNDEIFPKNRLVINLSLTINLPLERAHSKKKYGKILNRILSQMVDGEDSRFARSIELICNSLYAQGSKVIAASGNNRGSDRPRPLACYPAAFNSVLGVGALPVIKTQPDPNKKLKTASYSNLADRPKRSGITTLGGEKGKGKGVLGVYVGQFPSKTNPHNDPNTNGWGWWSGTSFATPIISGMVAAARSTLPQESIMEAAIAKLLQLFSAEPLKTEDNEDVLIVIQGT